MNADRRKALARAKELLSEALALIEQARDEEQEYFDNMPDSFRDNGPGQKAEEAISGLDDAVSCVQSAEDNLENVIGV